MKRTVVVLTALLAATLMSPPDAHAVDPPATEIVTAIVVPAPTQVAGVPYAFNAEVRANGHSLKNETLELQAKEAGAVGFTTYASVSTGPHGFATASIRLTYNAQLRWHHPATVNGAESFSTPSDQKVAVRVGARVNDRTLRVGQRLVVRGRTFPAKPGRIARLYRTTSCVDPVLRCPSPVLLAKATIASDGSYRIVKRFRSAGKRILFVGVPQSSRNLGGESTYRYVRVS